jgi:hypothetical protein
VLKELTEACSRLMNSANPYHPLHIYTGAYRSFIFNFHTEYPMRNTPVKPAVAAARNASPARPAKPSKSKQRPVLLADTPEQKALKAITSRVLSELKSPTAVPSTIIMAALKEARAL